jgi:hypothetical protein
MAIEKSTVSRWLGTGLLLFALVPLATAQTETGPAPPPPPPPPAAGGVMARHGPGPGNVMWFHQDMGENRVVKGVPMSGELVVTRDTTLADGNRIHTENQTKIYRDSEGRMRREIAFELITPRTGAAQGNMIAITDPVAGKRYMLNPRTKTVHEMPLHLGGPRGRHAPGGEPGEGPRFREGVNFQREQLGTKTINGLQAEGTRVTHTIPAGRIGNEKPIEVVSERWYSSELQMPVLTTHNDPMMGIMTSKLVNVTRGEPDASLFQIPSDYKVETGKPGETFYMPMRP